MTMITYVHPIVICIRINSQLYLHFLLSPSNQSLQMSMKRTGVSYIQIRFYVCSCFILVLVIVISIPQSRLTGKRPMSFLDDDSDDEGGGGGEEVTFSGVSRSKKAKTTDTFDMVDVSTFAHVVVYSRMYHRSGNFHIIKL